MAESLEMRAHGTALWVWMELCIERACCGKPACGARGASVCSGGRRGGRTASTGVHTRRAGFPQGDAQVGDAERRVTQRRRCSEKAKGSRGRLPFALKGLRAAGHKSESRRYIKRGARARVPPPRIIRRSRSSWRSCGGDLCPVGGAIRFCEWSAGRWCGACHRTGGRFPGVKRW